MPRSDSGRAAARGGLQEVLDPSFRSFVLSSGILRTKRVVGAVLNRRLHHPGAGRASARPSSAEEGSKNVPGALCSASMVGGLWGWGPIQVSKSDS